MPTLFADLDRRSEPDAAGVYARVAVERGLEAPAGDAALTYLASGLDVAVGQRVIVPLGRRNRPQEGTVIAVGGLELLEDLPPDKVKRILRVLPLSLPPALVELGRWISEYYLAPLGMVFASMMPAAVKREAGVHQRVMVEPLPHDQAATILQTTRLTPAAARAWTAISQLHEGWPCDPRTLATRIGLRSVAAINRLLQAGLLRRLEVRDVRTRTPWEHYALHDPGPPPRLTTHQRAAADGIARSLGQFGVHLLFGVTGSGKTEVYLDVAARVLAQGRSVLLLVPEIALTPQTAGRCVARLASAGRVALLHSGLSATERHRQWMLAATGQARVVIGARSAVFAPLRNLGLIVVDEEHAADYKQDQLPRYHARDVAIKRAQIERCPVVLGSATPSLESWSAAQSRRYQLWELPHRVGSGTLPHVEIVDLAREREADDRRRTDLPPARQGVSPGHLRAIGPRLAAALRDALASGGQAILLLNRRGHSRYLCCPSSVCGWVLSCDDCDAAMVLHRVSGPPQGQVVRCHHCLAERLVPHVCPVCGRPLLALGAGTQRLEEELIAALGSEFDLEAGRTVVRADADTMRTARDYFRVLERFGAGDIRVLLGTQMIAKGLDFPNVRLVGVINADTSLALPDFRSAERTYQLVSQVAGRAGRGPHRGLVIVQTINPDAPAIVLAAAHDYRAFADQELAIRRRAALPPAARMARIVVRDTDAQRAARRAEHLASLLRQWASPQPDGPHTQGPRADAARLRVLGPGPCPVARIARLYRFAVEVLAPTARDVHAALVALRQAGQLRSDAHTAVDVDPVALM